MNRDKEIRIKKREVKKKWREEGEAAALETLRAAVAGRIELKQAETDLLGVLREYANISLASVDVKV